MTPKDLPFKFGVFYIWCGFIGAPYLIYLATQESSTESILNIIYAIIFFVESVGLYKRKYWGLIAFYVWFMFATILQPIIYLYTNSMFFAISYTIFALPLNIPMLIYFYKRRFMFN